MRCGFLSRFDDMLWRTIGGEPRNIFRNCAIKQLHPLRQIADMFAQNLRRIIVKRRAIKPNFPDCRRPDPGLRCGPEWIYRRPRGR